jgi:hypothetical protein
VGENAAGKLGDGEADTVPHRTFRVTDETATYMISRSDFPDGVTNLAEARGFYDEGRDTNLEDEGSRLLSEREVRLGNYIGREITIISPNGTERVRWFAIGKLLYEIRITIDIAEPKQRDAALAKETTRFLDRFRLTDTRTGQFVAEEVNKGKPRQ